MIRKLLPRLVLPMLLVLAVEGLFRFGIWEPLAAPDSHAGTSIRVKRAVSGFPRPIDFVTLGSSRVVYGLDHRLIAERAASHGFTHANLGMPGSHWLSVNTLIDWLHQRRPELQGGIIALALPDLTWNSNGNYEIAIATPLQVELLGGARLHQRFAFDERGSWGAASVLWQYRSDIQEFVGHPVLRRKTLRWFADNAAHSLFDGPRPSFDACGLHWQTLASCAAIEPTNPDQAHLQQTCQGPLATLAPVPDWRDFAAGREPPERAAVREQRQRDLRNTGWPRPPVLILMPITQHWRDELLPRGMAAWAHRMLDPLVAEGSIHLLDYSDFFDRDGATRCDVFWDIYHQNGKGARELTEALLPELDRLLYDVHLR